MKPESRQKLIRDLCKSNFDEVVWSPVTFPPVNLWSVPRQNIVIAQDENFSEKFLDTNEQPR